MYTVQTPVAIGLEQNVCNRPTQASNFTHQVTCRVTCTLRPVLTAVICPEAFRLASVGIRSTRQSTTSRQTATCEHWIGNPPLVSCHGASIFSASRRIFFFLSRLSFPILAHVVGSWIYCLSISRMVCSRRSAPSRTYPLVSWIVRLAKASAWGHKDGSFWTINASVSNAISGTA